MRNQTSIACLQNGQQTFNLLRVSYQRRQSTIRLACGVLESMGQETTDPMATNQDKEQQDMTIMENIRGRRKRAIPEPDRAFNVEELGKDIEEVLHACDLDHEAVQQLEIYIPKSEQLP